MNRRSVLGAGLALAALTSSLALMMPGAASATPARMIPATQILPSAPPGQATLVTYYLNGAHTDDPVGQRIVGNCSAFVPWGTTTSYYSTTFVTCSN